MRKISIYLFGIFYLMGSLFLGQRVHATDVVAAPVVSYKGAEVIRTSGNKEGLQKDEEVSIKMIYRVDNTKDLGIDSTLKIDASKIYMGESDFIDSRVRVSAEIITFGKDYFIAEITMDRLRYDGTGNLFGVEGTIPFANEKDETIEIDFSQRASINVSGKNPDAPTTNLEPYLTKYEVSSPTIKKNDIFSIALEVVDPNYKYSDLVNKTFDTSFALLSDKNYNASNMQGAIENVGADALGNLKYSVRFTNIRYIGPAQALSFRVTYSMQVVIDGKVYNALIDQTLTRNIFEASGEEADPDSIFAPNILISNYTGTGGVVAGKQINFKVTFKNTSTSVAVNNIIIGINGGEAFAMAKGVNKIFVNEILPGKEISIDLSMIASKTATPSSYPIKFSVSYNYIGDKGAVASGTLESDIAIPVTQVDRVRINYAKVSNAYVDQEAELSYSILNTGLSQVKNAQIEVFNENEESLGILFLGSIDPGKEIKGTNMYLMFNEGKEYALTMKLTYEDENFNQKELKDGFTVNVMGGGGFLPPIEPNPMPVEPEKKSNNAIFFVGALAVAALACGFVIYKRKKNKQGVIDDEGL